MKENNDKDVIDNKKRFNWQIIIPIVIAIIIVAVFLYLDYKKDHEQTEEPNGEEQQQEQSESYKPKPIPPSENPRRSEQLDPGLGCASPLNIKPDLTEEHSKEWLIDKNGEKTIVSLGKYKITAPIYLFFDIPKLWLYFFSKKLSDREDFLYGLEESYTSRILLIVNGHERELNLGGSEYMFIELSNFPLGDLYPYDKEAILEFEFLIELKCKNLENKKCLDNEGKSLDYLKSADIGAQIRIFAVGCQEFSNDLMIESVFKY